MKDVLVTVYTYSITGRDIQIRFSEEIFLDEQPEAIGKAIIDAWKLMYKDRPGHPSQKLIQSSPNSKKGK